MKDMIVWPDNTPEWWYYLPVQEAATAIRKAKDDAHETWTSGQKIRIGTLKRTKLFGDIRKGLSHKRFFVYATAPFLRVLLFLHI